MLNGYKILTVTHKQTNLKNIADFVIPMDDTVEQSERLRQLKETFGLSELLYLATCNRVMYFFYTQHPLPADFQNNFFKRINPGLDEEAIRQVRLIEGASSIHHLFEVAASIDSLVVGEREILRQLREAYTISKEWSLTGDHIRMAIQSAIVAAKDVYANTRIGEKPVSIVSLAIEKMLERQLPKSARILLVGAGQTNSLVAKFLLKHEYHNVIVFNRTLQKAQNLAANLGGSAKSLSELPIHTGGFDCLIVCTGAQTPVITSELYQHLIHGESEEKTVIDLAIPHNVAPGLVQKKNFHYIEIEGLRQLAQQNLAFREREVDHARIMLEEHVNNFELLLRQRLIERAMKKVPDEIKAVKSHALNNVFKKEVEQLDDQTRALFERALSYMEKKCIGIPMKAARETFLP